MPPKPPFVFDPKATATALRELLNDVATRVTAPGRFSVEIEPPDLAEVQECFHRNCTAEATIILSYGRAKPLNIPIPYPYHGVFVMGSGNGRLDRPTEARLMTWRPCLVRRLGLWLLHSYKDDDSEIPGELRLIPGPVPLKKPPKKQKKVVNQGDSDDEPDSKGGKKPKYRLLLPHRRHFKTTLGKIRAGRANEQFKEFLDSDPVMLDESGRTRVAELARAVIDVADKSLFLDKDDLNTQRLYTYGLFLVENLAYLICNRWLSEEDCSPTEDYWAQTDGLDLGAAIRTQMHDWKNYVWLHPFEHRSAIDAISSLTAFSRYGWPSNTLKNLPARFRQNHRSFRSLVCPVQTPESEHVGLTLHLAATAAVNQAGVLSRAKPKGHGLGYAASLLPFYHHTDAARAMMGAKNLVQALPVKGAEKPLVTTGEEGALREVLRPLTDSCLLRDDEAFFAPGRNLLVAYMPWFGLNYNDAIVANRDLTEKLAFSKEHRFTMYLEPGDCPIPDARGDGIVLFAKQSGNSVEAHETLATIRTRFGERRPVECQARGVLVEEPQYHDIPPGFEYGGMIEWKIRTESLLEVGDKLMGRHGNKGVISTLLPPSQMPRLPVDKRLGDLSGRSVDLVLNPLGVISRMNIGQLMETHVGLLHRLGIEGLPPNIGKPFRQVDFKKIVQPHFATINEGREPVDEPVVDEYGRMRLTIPGKDGKPDTKTGSPVTVGFQYIVRLDQIPSNKAHYRGDGKWPYGYNRVTGQAVKGKRSNGGQRIGEMEMWALDAYQAKGLLEDVLTDVFKPRGCSDEGSQTFRALRSHLFALGVDLKREGGTYRLTWADAVTKSSQYREVSYHNGTPALRRTVKGTFMCPNCQKEDKSWTGYGSAGNCACVEDLLKAKDVRFENPEWGTLLPRSGRLPPLAVGSTPLRATWTRKLKSGTVRAELTIADETFYAYVRSNTLKAKRAFRLIDLLRMPLSCPDHTTTNLVCNSPQSRGTVKALGGLADEYVFADETHGWGYIDLHASIKASKCLGEWASVRPDFTVIPVLPWRYRETLPLEEGALVPNELTVLYEDLAIAAQRRKGVTKALRELFRFLCELLEGKEGLICREGKGRRIDDSGRFVVVPDPELGWDECGLPLEVLLVMFKDKLLGPDSIEKLAMMDGTGFHDKKSMPATVQRYLAEYAWPERVRPPLRRPIEDLMDQHLRAAKPLVLVNRQPSLHRYNIKALRPVILGRHRKRELGDLLGKTNNDSQKVDDTPLVVSINPLICHSTGCDFDGDEVSIHLVAEKNLKEAEALLPTARGNLLSLANNGPTTEFDQDMVLGSYLISMDPTFRATFVERILPTDCETCRDFAALDGRWDADACRDLFGHLCASHHDHVATSAPEWMRMAFEAATLMGVSFGFLDLLACRSARVGKLLRKWHRNGPPKTPAGWEQRNKDLESAVKKRLKEIVSTGDHESPGFGVAAMAISGARGDKQVRQLVGARGYLDPGDVNFDFKPARFFFPVSLADGMRQESAFYASMNGRMSMVDKKLATGKAGALTRSLVLACWPWRVKRGDCELNNDMRSPATCAWANEKLVCSKCYGLLPDGSEPPDHYPAGLIAAQSIGERGTQLSMKGFHTGTKAVDIEGVKAKLKDGGLFDLKTGSEQFYQALHDIEAYQHLSRQHFDLLWRAIASSGQATLAGAINREAADDLFVGLVGGYTGGSRKSGGQQWRYVALAIDQKWGSDAQSALASIMIGRAGASEEPESEPTGDNAVDISPMENLIATLGGGLTENQLAALDGAEKENKEETDAHPVVDQAQPVSDPGDQDEEPSGFNDNESDEGTDEESDTPEFREPSFGDRISLVVCGATDSLQCRIEIPTRAKLNSTWARLARAFGTWLVQNHPGFVQEANLSMELPLTQNAVLPEIRPHMFKRAKAGKPEKSAKSLASKMSEFVSRAWLIWPTKCLPVRALFDEDGLLDASLTGRRDGPRWFEPAPDESPR